MTSVVSLHVAAADSEIEYLPVHERPEEVKMAELPDGTWRVRDAPSKHPEMRRLHRPGCRWAFSPKMRSQPSYREATEKEIRTNPRCGYCC
jgi:hypothetical protein